ncbi:rCG22761 [Rattus norvegicus]|uniref:RCG22761 n=1 Tax=Rattus norvegicus TaxID=10116 RepID=A6JYH1_RAT|nr:rCG22761 [Rattus norvegicus]
MHRTRKSNGMRTAEARTGMGNIKKPQPSPERGTGTWVVRVFMKRSHQGNAIKTTLRFGLPPVKKANNKSWRAGSEGLVYFRCECQLVQTQ